MRMAAMRALPVWARYGATALLVLACLLGRLALLGHATAMPYMLFMPGIIAAGVLFDRGTGFVATVASAGLGLWYFVPPQRSLAVTELPVLFELATFLAIGFFTATLLEALHHAISSLASERAELSRANADLRSTAAERGTLLSESVHRARNDLQRLASTLRLKAGTYEDPAARAALNEASGRIAALARINGRLDRHREEDGKAQVDSRGFLEGLVADLEDAAVDMRPVALSVMADSSVLPMSRAVPLGLIVNELVGNALKYAFPDDAEGRIAVALRREPEAFVLTVEDDGIGADPAAPPRGSGLGTRISRALAAQLGGKLHSAPVAPGRARPGLRWTVRFPAGSAGPGVSLHSRP